MKHLSKCTKLCSFPQLLWESAHIGFITVLYFFTGLIVILFRIFTFSSAYFWLVSSVFASFSSAFIFQ